MFSGEAEIFAHVGLLRDRAHGGSINSPRAHRVRVDLRHRVNSKRLRVRFGLQIVQILEHHLVHNSHLPYCEYFLRIKFGKSEISLYIGGNKGLS